MLTDKPATVGQYHSLILKLSRRGEYALDALQRASVDELMLGLGGDGAPPVMLPFALLGQTEVQYLVRLTGLEIVRHAAHGHTTEYIGYLDNTCDRIPVGVRLGASEEYSYIKLV